MDINSVNASVPVDRQTLASENQEPKQTEVNETRSQESREPYRVNISQEAQQAQANGSTTPPESLPSGTAGSEAVQTYTSAGQIAG
ncbi:MAG: hypothetical protein KKD44_22835 [Proteobacteria bacterium]|nr:hypothetical protein [Pseudomonadota bacterium]